ncbi:hypothetical protein TcWFU_002460 [Taenia crassiceps]|uniref:Secreted protein n=1 Tax=Taenia crassiceps TaxID=6207 RepID=A0ABR4QQB7_9CEST
MRLEIAVLDLGWYARQWLHSRCWTCGLKSTLPPVHLVCGAFLVPSFYKRVGRKRIGHNCAFLHALLRINSAQVRKTPRGTRSY